MSPIHATYRTYLILHDLITLIIFGEACTSLHHIIFKYRNILYRLCIRLVGPCIYELMYSNTSGGGE